MQRSQSSNCAALECILTGYYPNFACRRRTSPAQNPVQTSPSQGTCCQSRAPVCEGNFRWTEI